MPTKPLQQPKRVIPTSSCSTFISLAARPDSLVAVRLHELDVPCLFVSGKAPSFSMPDLALGCLMKPFTAEEVHRSLAMAEDLLRGRETVRPRPPQNLTLYEPDETGPAIEPGYIPSKRSLRTRLEHWISRHPRLAAECAQKHRAIVGGG